MSRTPTGLYGKILQETSNPEIQRTEATKLLQLMQTLTPPTYGNINYIETPVPMLVQVPGTNRVRFMLGLTFYMGNPMEELSPLHSKFLALHQDLDEASDTPQVVVLPDDLLKFNAVNAPTDKQFEAMLKSKQEAQEGDTIWFKESTVKQTSFQLPKAIPFPPYLAYDAFTEDIPAHVMYERVKDVEDTAQAPEVMTMAKNFFKAVHTKHNQGKKSVSLPETTFTSRSIPETRKWAKSKQHKLFPSLGGNTLPATPTRGGGEDLTTLLQAFITAQAAGTGSPTSVAAAIDPAAEQMKRYGMCESDHNHFLKLCGLKPGQEELLPAWVEDISKPNMMKDGKHRLIRNMCKDLLYEDHKIPLFPAIFTMIEKKAFGGDDDGSSALAAMKGLTLYLMVNSTAAEVEEMTEFAEQLQAATSTSVSDIKSLHKKKAAVPASHYTLLQTLRKYANLLKAIFGPRSPLLLELQTEVIRPLATMAEEAKSALAGTTRASIMWTVYLQTKHFTRGDMVGEGALMGQWRVMTINIASNQNLTLLGLPKEIDGAAPLPPVVAAADKKRKPNEALKERGDTRQKTWGSNQPQQQNRPIKMEIHPLIQSKITAVLPSRCLISKLLDKCKVNHISDVFPGTRLCVIGALKGTCHFGTKCVQDHDGSKVTDKMAQSAINMLQPIINNPKLLQGM